MRQEVVATLGRAEKVMASGQIAGLLRSLAKFTRKRRVVEASRQPDIQAHLSRSWGPALACGRLWGNQGVPAIIEQLSRGRKFGFDIERVAFAIDSLSINPRAVKLERNDRAHGQSLEL